MKSLKTLFLLLAAICMISCAETHKHEQLEGIDLSHHNSISDWSKLDVDFIYLKATEGTGWRDPKFNEYRKEARKYGIPVGAYHFMTTASSAKEQFDSFKDACANDIDLIPVLDIERQSKGYQLTKKELQSHVLEWCELCKKHYGTYPIIYSSLEFYQQHFNGVLDDMLFWCGDVDASVDYVNRKEWILWQKEISHIAGAKRSIDINVLNKGHELSDIMLK